MLSHSLTSNRVLETIGSSNILQVLVLSSVWLITYQRIRICRFGDYDEVLHALRTDNEFLDLRINQGFA